MNDDEFQQQQDEEQQMTPDLNHALVQAQLEMKNPKFDSNNPHFKSKFASLKSVRDAVIPVFAKHGIAVVQDLQTIDGQAAVYTILLHETGDERTFGPLIVPSTKPDAQGLASASTYARRYSLQSAAGVVGEEDDDGNAASEPDTNFKSKQAKTKYWKGFRDAASENDAGKARELWDELNNEQREELWHELSSGIRSTLKELLESTGKEL